MSDRSYVSVLTGAVLLALLAFTIGVDALSEGIGPFFLMAILAVLALTLFFGVMQRTGRTQLLQAERSESIGEPGPAHFFFHDARSAPVWLILRLYVGFAWLEAGYHKLTGSGWMDGGAALAGYWTKAIAIDPDTGKGAITYGWYRDFLSFMLANQWEVWFAKVIVYGEILVALGLIFGVLTGWAAFFGLLMNMSFMLAGSASTNPVLFSLSILLILGWRIAGYYGLDRILLPLLGVPGLGRPASNSFGGTVEDVPRTT